MTFSEVFHRSWKTICLANLIHNYLVSHKESTWEKEIEGTSETLSNGDTQMAEKMTNKLNIPETEAEVRAEQLSNEFRAGRIMLRIFAAGVLGLAVLFGFVAVQVFRLCVI